MTGARHVLLPFLARQRRALLVAGVATVVVAAAEVLRPFPLKLVVDHLFEGGAAAAAAGEPQLALLAGIAVLVLAIALFEAAGSYLMDVRLMRAGERIVHDLRTATYAHLQRLSLGFHQRRHTGDLVTRVTGDVNAVGALFSSSLATMVTAVLTLVGMLVVGFVIDPVLALLAFATAPLIGVVAFRFRRRMGVLQRRQRETEGEIASLATEALSSMQQVRALGSEAHEHQRLERKSEERLAAGYEASIAESQFTRVIDVVGAIGTAVVLVAGVMRVGAGALSPGDLVVMVTYVRRVYRPLRTMAREWVRFSRAMVRAERVAELLASDDVLVERHRPAPRGRLRGELRFDAVSFAYGPDRSALNDVSLDIAAGERVALVGRSGAGKSTLAAMAARFYDPAAGQVLIDGIDARDYPLSWLRGQVGLVLQDPVLFTGTVAENIAWGLDVGPDDIVRAAAAIGANGFIEQLPQGYDTELDPAGAGLSGGQRQRIAIARTLLRAPQILILDEPTTGLDATSEAEVLAGLDVLMRGRTTIIITHSPSLARRADRVVVLDSGHTVRTGTPDEIIGDAAAAAVSPTSPDHTNGRKPPAARSRSAARRRPTAAPPPIADSSLPNAGLLLDPTAVAPVLERSFGSRGLDVRVRYLRYKPGTNLVVHYAVTSDGRQHDAVVMIAAGDQLGRRAAKAESTALAESVAPRVAALRPLAHEPDVDCLIQWYPLDLALPALAIPPAELRRLLRGARIRIANSDEEPVRLAYKPRRRAVLRLGRHVVKFYRRQDEFERALAGQFAASGLRAIAAPRLEAVLAERLLTVQSLLAGDPVADPTASAAKAGSLLATVHGSAVEGLDEFGPAAQLAAAGASARLVGTIAPDLAPRLGRLLELLATESPRDVALVPSHGDFNARQLLEHRGALAATDFDEFCMAPAALDPATYAAYLVRGQPDDLLAARRALDELCRGYAHHPDHLEWYLATMILRRSARPFRYFEPNWPARVEAMVNAAESVVAHPAGVGAG